MKKLSVVGIGPGNEVYSSIEARETLEGSDLIIGYKKYVELVEEYLPDKELFRHRAPVLQHLSAQDTVLPGLHW